MPLTRTLLPGTNQGCWADASYILATLRQSALHKCQVVWLHPGLRELFLGCPERRRSSSPPTSTCCDVAWLTWWCRWMLITPSIKPQAGHSADWYVFCLVENSLFSDITSRVLCPKARPFLFFSFNTVTILMSVIKENGPKLLAPFHHQLGAFVQFATCITVHSNPTMSFG